MRSGLVRAELRRLFSRRLTRLMLALVVALMATVAVVTAVNHQRPGPAAVAVAEAAAAREFQQQQRFIEQDIDACEQAQASGSNEEMGWPEDCQEIRQFYSSQEEMVEWHMPPAFEFRDDFRPMITVFAALLGLFAFLVGASFVGAEWRSGGMMNLLLWRPRRLQVLGAKLLALIGSLLGIGLLGGAAWTGAFWLVARFRGVTDTMTAGTWESFGLSGLRGLVLALVAGGLGFALASLGRHTAMAMGWRSPRSWSASAGWASSPAGCCSCRSGSSGCGPPTSTPGWTVRWSWSTGTLPACQPAAASSGSASRPGRRSPGDRPGSGSGRCWRWRSVLRCGRSAVAT